MRKNPRIVRCIVDKVAIFYYFRIIIVFGNQYSVFYSDFRKWRELPLKGILLKNSKNGEGANESLPFFIVGIIIKSIAKNERIMISARRFL